MQFRKNAEVFTKEGDKVGEINRVVIDPRTNEVTHVVIRQGFLLTEDKVVPVGWFEETAEKVTVLSEDKAAVDELPPYEEVHYAPWQSGEDRKPYPESQAEPYFWYPPANVYWWNYPAYRHYFDFGEPPLVTEIDRAVPEGSTVLKEGARVISADHRHVGNVEEVIASPDSGHITHLVISSGLLFKNRKLVPTAWIDHLEDDGVYLSVKSSFLGSLEPYQG